MQNLIILASILLLSLFVCSVFCVDERATLLVKKTIANNEVIVNKPSFVTIEIFNIGNGAAYDVSLTDDVDDEGDFSDDKDEFVVTAGLTEAHWDQIPAGGNVTHTYVVKAVELGLQDVNSAKVTYKPSATSDHQVGYSSDLGKVEVLSRVFRDRSTSSHIREWGVFAALATLSCLIPFAIWYSVNYDSTSSRKQKST